ncbi:MAG: hypothetical protein JSS40_06450 [Proteobacteria bacterium]|nr:hypothetical protein [Pseudomonadota bacterium]
MSLRPLLLAAFLLCTLPARADTELVMTARFPNGDPVPYMLDSASPRPKYLLVLFPGGSGDMNLRMEDGKIKFGLYGNFLIRSRPLFVDQDFATVSTNATGSEERVQVLLDDLKRRYPDAKVYLIGTSNGTGPTMSLAGFLQDKVAGEIHTSSRAQVYSFDGKAYRNRQLVVHHINDWCRVTPYSAAKRSNEKFGTELITMEGGISTGSECEAYAHHGYNGIEKETVDAIKTWIRKGG